MMFPAIANSSSCEILAAIRFLHAENKSGEDIQRELCTVYGENINYAGTARKWRTMFKDGLTNRCSH
jgi:hypothetical protein